MSYRSCPLRPAGSCFSEQTLRLHEVLRSYPATGPWFLCSKTLFYQSAGPVGLAQQTLLQRLPQPALPPALTVKTVVLVVFLLELQHLPSWTRRQKQCVTSAVASASGEEFFSAMKRAPSMATRSRGGLLTATGA